MTLTKIRFGSSTPNNAVGIDGDLYLRSNGDWYQRDGGVYVLIDYSGSSNLSNIGTDLYLFYSY